MEAFFFESIIAILRGYLFKSAKLAKYAKYAIRLRDYLVAFFPLETYPTGSTGDTLLENTEITPVAVTEVKKAAKTEGFKFNIPFVKGM